MRTQVNLICFLLTLTLSYGQNSMREKVTAKMDQSVLEQLTVGVASAATVNGNIVYSHSVGFSNLETQTPFTTTTINRTASISKPITAVAIMQLVEAGKVNLDTKVANYLDEFNASELNLITVRHVLQHSAGLNAYKNNKEANNKKQYNSLEEALAIFIKRELLFKPGTDFSYTSYGYVVLGLVIERVSGLSYAEYVRQYIFKPAGMVNTSVEQSGVWPDGKSKIYHQVKPGKIKEITTHNISDRLPGGGVQSTAEDLLLFGNAILSNTLISEESLAAMIVDSGLKKEGNGYGMGWYLYGENPTMGNVFGHNGAQYGCSSFLFILPEKNIVTVALSNTSAYDEVGTLAMALFTVADEAKN